MSATPARSFSRLAIAIVVAALVLGSAIYLGTATTITRTTSIINTETSTSTLFALVPNPTTVTSTTTITATITTTAPMTSTPTASSASSAEYVTGTSFTNASDAYLTTCSVTGIGGLEIRIVSDYTTASVSGELVNAVDTLGCDIVGQPPETQVVHIDKFAVGQGGWLTPIFPNQAQPGGQLSFTVVYLGSTYRFTETVPPIGTVC